ncbi:MAG: hypothetical protein V3R75_02725 [Alphaproteobacteria bacterium]
MDASAKDSKVVVLHPRRGPKSPRLGGGRPTKPQRDWLERGLSQSGGKLPLFDESGQRVSDRTVRACIRHGWAEPWFDNPLKSNWLVCKLTDDGRQILHHTN